MNRQILPNFLAVKLLPSCPPASLLRTHPPETFPSPPETRASSKSLGSGEEEAWGLVLVLVNCWPPLRSRNETLTTLCPDIMMKMGKISEVSFFFEIRTCLLRTAAELQCGCIWDAVLGGWQ
jgi:hypothetical protein